MKNLVLMFPGQGSQAVGMGCDMAAALHELEIIFFIKIAALFLQRLYHRPAGIIHQQQDMGQLDGGVLAHPDPGRQTGENRPLGRPNQADRPGVIIVFFKIDAASGTGSFDPSAASRGDARPKP